MLAGEYHFENGISGFVSALAPTATISLLSLVGNKLIWTLIQKSITQKSGDWTGNNSETPTNTAIISQEGGSSPLMPVSSTSCEGMQ